MISSMQKNMDQVVEEKTQLEVQTNRLEDKLLELNKAQTDTEMRWRAELGETKKAKEQVMNIQLNIRDIHEKLDMFTKLDNSFKNMAENIEETKEDFSRKLQANSCKTSELEDLLGCELRNLKVSVTSSGQMLQQNFMEEFTEVSKNIQEKAEVADTRLNEALELLQSHARLIEMLKETTTEINKGSESLESYLQKVDYKVKSCISDLSRLEQFATTSDLKKAER